jgi:predicted ATPase
MLKTLTISNYRSLGKNVQIDFGELTVFVGANGSGKSNVMDALRFVADALTMGLSGAITMRQGIGSVRRWSSGHPYNVAVRLDLALSSGPAFYSFELSGSSVDEYRVKLEEAQIVRGDEVVKFRIEEGKWKEGPTGLRPPLDKMSLAIQLVGGDERFQELVRSLQNMAVYTIFPDTLRAPQKYSPNKPMSRHGDNWVSILKDQPRETWKDELVAALNKLTGDTVDIKVSQAAGFLVAQFQHASPERDLKKWFNADQESDGTLRVAGIVTALLQDPPVPVIGIEEPELTVHPGAIPLLYNYLTQARRHSQVVVTTHSPVLLDLVDPEDVRVVERRDGETRVARMAESQRVLVRSGLMKLGEVMQTEGIQSSFPFSAE